MSGTLGIILKTARKKANRTQFDVANKVGISRNYLSDIENDRYIPSVPVLIKISKEIGVDLNLLTKMTEIQV